MRCIGAVAPSPALCASSCIFSGCGNTALTKPRLNEPSRGALDGVAPRQQMSSSPSRDAGTIEGGGHAEAVLCTSPGWHTGSGLEPTAPRRAEDRRIHRPPPQPLCRFPRSQDERVPSGGAPGPEPFPGVLKG